MISCSMNEEKRPLPNTQRIPKSEVLTKKAQKTGGFLIQPESQSSRESFSHLSEQRKSASIPKLVEKRDQTKFTLDRGP